MTWCTMRSVCGTRSAISTGCTIRPPCVVPCGTGGRFVPVNQHCSARRLWQLIADRVDRAEWPLLGLNQQRGRSVYSVSKGRARFDCLTSLTTPERDASSLIEHSIYGLYRISKGMVRFDCLASLTKNRNRHSAEYYWILQRRFHAREKRLIWVNREIIYTQETREITTCKILVSKQNYSKCKIIHKT